MIRFHKWSLWLLLVIPACTQPKQMMERTDLGKAEAEKLSKIDPAYDPLNGPEAPKLVLFSQIMVLRTPSILTYPRSAKDRGFQGEVLVEVWINGKGVPTKSVAIWGPEEFRLNDEQWLSGWRFWPVLQDGNPIPVRFRMRVVFNIQGGGEFQHIPREYIF